MNSLRFSRSRWVATLAGALSIVASSLGMVTASAAGAADLRSGGNLVVVASGLSQMGSGQLRGVCVDPSGNLFFVNTLKPFIFELTVSSNYTQVITVAGTGASGNLVAGAATSSPINRPRALICRPSGNILFTTVNQVGKLTRNGSSYNVSVIAGSGGSGQLVNGGDALTEPLSAPGGLTVGNNGVIYTVDSSLNVVYSFTPSGSGYVMNIIAGTGSAGTPSSGPSLQSSLFSPTDIAFTPSGTLLVSDTNNGFVEQLTSTSQGWYTRIVGQFSAPRGLAVDANGNVYVADSIGNRIAEMTPYGNSYDITVVAGSGVAGFPVAGPATSSPLNNPRFIALDSYGDLFIGDSGNGVVEAVLPNSAVAPTAPTVIAESITSSGAITFDWSVSNNGGADITSYSWSGACSGSGNTTTVTCTGLIGGQNYLLAVTATNSAGTSDLGYAMVQALTVPDAPTVIAESITSSGAITFDWSVGNNGGADITSYSWSGACSGSGNTTTVTCTGLSNHQDYTLWVTATNALGDSTPGSSTATGETVPDAPQAVNLSAGVGSISVDGIATSNDGGSAVTSYTVIATDPAGNTQACTVAFDSSQSTQNCVLQGLTNGTTYQVAVFATNTLGNSSSLDAGSVSTPDVPAAPVVTTAPVSSSGEITYNWVDLNTGGSDITSYTWSGACSGSGNTTTVTCTGLTGGTSYELNVTATNGVGTSEAGSSSATARTIPGSVSAISTWASHGSIDVSWSAPSDDGGDAVSSYTVTATDASGNSFTCIAGPGLSANWTACSVTGLSDATSYDITVIAHNSWGASISTDGGWVSTVSYPHAPTVTVQPVTTGGEITFSWSVSDNGGRAITSYTWSGACSGSGNVTTVTCTGLAGGTSYELKVTATNGVGTSDSGSAQVTTPSVPSAPRYVTTTVTLHSVTVTWSPALTNGGSPVTAYVATALDANNHEHVCTANSSATTCTIANLDSGATYGVSVVALSEWGNSPSANGGSSTTWRLPAAPAVGSALSRSRAAVLNWSAPSDNGGSAVSSYTVTDGHGHQCITALTSCTISGLTNGTSYVFTVTASSLAGTSPVATFASVMPLGANITQRVAGFDISSASVTADMATQIRALASAIMASGRHSVTITGYGNVGIREAVRLARATHARSILLAALVAAGHHDVVISVAVGPASTTFGTGGPAVLAASRRCVVIATH